MPLMKKLSSCSTLYSILRVAGSFFSCSNSAASVRSRVLDAEGLDLHLAVRRRPARAARGVVRIAAPSWSAGRCGCRWPDRPPRSSRLRPRGLGVGEQRGALVRRQHAGDLALVALLEILDGREHRIVAGGAPVKSPVHSSAAWIFRRSPSGIPANASGTGSALAAAAFGAAGFGSLRPGFSVPLGFADFTGLSASTRFAARSALQSLRLGWRGLGRCPATPAPALLTAPSKATSATGNGPQRIV